MESLGTIMGKPDSQNAEWQDTLVNASRALAHLDADRLEEMALSCAALVREDHEARSNSRGYQETGSGETTREMAIFARVLEATRANLNVMRRLRAVRATQLEYGRRRDVCAASEESEHGDH
jgi:hypothetical protein